ncbi:M48 family metallopeptidase [Solimicrobium silvestre]|uniref:Peptidase family M48 n=1 Tax=Solimicrobium silvestre TaxID=2099400 RepID=A0A2S9GXT8_9BURK|nr:M48 family metallopeptidase [Solimicrobium silvestre]PRC92529.1 Peptidase family M48 [Solimicrobium silvestre]
MEMDRFKSMVTRLEQESAATPTRYRLKVIMLTLVGFGILALILAAVGLGLVLVVGFAAAMVFTGGAALILLLKLGKLLILLALPFWFTLKSSVQALFIRMPAPTGREINRTEAPQLFAALDNMRSQMDGPRVHHVLLINDVNAAVVQRPALGLFGWPRNYLLLGLPLLEYMTPDEALAVVAHEYGHLAGSHGRFSAFIYRLRHTWSTVEAYISHFQGWLSRLISPMVRWYASYFNAYTFVLARADEYRADAASAELVGSHNATRALKRVNIIAPRFRQYLENTFKQVNENSTPPNDLLQRWASSTSIAPEETQMVRWLEDALDKEGHFADTHPTLRKRLVSIANKEEELLTLPPTILEEPASSVWFAQSLESLRIELQEQWAKQVAPSWGTRHIEIHKQQMRLQELQSMPHRDTERQFEMLNLLMRLEPETDIRTAWADFNAANTNHALGLYFEGIARLNKGEQEGLALLDLSMQLDPQATKPACERAYSFLVERKSVDMAESYAVRWRERDALEKKVA